MKSRYMAQIRLGDREPALHVVATNEDWAMDTAQAKAAELARQRPGAEVRVDLYRWERGIWEWLDSRSHMVLQSLPLDAMDDYSTALGAERGN